MFDCRQELEKARQASRVVHREALQAAQRDETMMATLNHMQPSEKQRYQVGPTRSTALLCLMHYSVAMNNTIFNRVF